MTIAVGKAAEVDLAFKLRLGRAPSSHPGEHAKRGGAKKSGDEQNPHHQRSGEDRLLGISGRSVHEARFTWARTQASARD